jgi:hypothetical protein
MNFLDVPPKVFLIILFDNCYYCYYLTNDNYPNPNRLVKKVIFSLYSSSSFNLLHLILLFGNVTIAVSEHVLRSHEMYAINMLTHVVEEGTYVFCIVLSAVDLCRNLHFFFIFLIFFG